MEKERKKFKKHGSSGRLREISADCVLMAIKNERGNIDICIENCVITGNLDVWAIAGSLDQNEDGKPILRGNINIRFSEIHGSTSFRTIVLGGNVSFRKTVFGEKLWCDKTIFSGSVTFVRAVFKGDAGFTHATFKKDVSFISAEFIEYADFGSANFKGDVRFLNALVRRPAGFAGVKFRENKTLKGFWNDGIRPIICWEWWPISYAFSTLWKRMEKKGHKSTDFSRRSDFICKLQEKVRKWKLPVTDFDGFNTTKVMDVLSNPYLKRYIDDEHWIRSWRGRKKLRGFLSVIWELTSHCGRSVSLWASWSAAVAFIFALTYMDLGCDSIAFNVDKLNGIQPGFWGYLYYSIVTFTTLGFGDIVPLTNPARLAVGAEVVLGYVMLGGLISIFANKFARRS